jgi:plasmid stabilization system protein ParE
MKFSVVAQAAAVADATEIDSELRERDPAYADRWTDELEMAFANLAEYPNRHAFAPESEGSSFAIRQVFVGRYRMRYAVHGNSVRILRIRHASRRPFKPGELN